ncbi:hypothetical protein V497_03028 [Pseudogymnoascus sp. VKM F-4516 (FW-969)]|nr:hypothetical protein V497_03028 [Pseudogymnoascus sp. VKM F-4516 (FW-969)]
MRSYGLLTLTVLGGGVGAVVACGVFWSCVEKYRRWKVVEAEKRAAWPSDNQSGPPPPPSSSSWETEPSPPSTPSREMPTQPPKASPKKKPRRTLGWSKLSILALAALPGKATAYPCTGYDAVSYQYFVNPTHTIYGVVYGWISNCKDTKKRTYSNVSPADYVSDILPSIGGCGFELVDAVEGDTNLRVASAGIERGWRVRVSVNGFNVTRSTETDGLVVCLHDIGKSKK